MKSKTSISESWERPRDRQNSNHVGSLGPSTFFAQKHQLFSSTVLLARFMMAEKAKNACAKELEKYQ